LSVSVCLSKCPGACSGVLYQSIIYVGFAKALAALHIAKEVCAEFGGRVPDKSPKPWVSIAIHDTEECILNYKRALFFANYPI
jgi:hypothetical protein